MSTFNIHQKQILTVITFVILSSAFATNTSSRALHFSKDRSLGQIKIQTDRNPNWYHISQTPGDKQWEYLCEATGNITVPVGKKIGLNLNHRVPKDLSSLAELRSDDLHMLSLCQNFNDNCMRHITHLTDLKVLHLAGTKITSKSIKHLKNFKSLETLSIPRQINSSSLAYLSNLKNLKTLRLSNLPTDAGLSKIAKITSLKEIYFAADRVNGPGLAELAKMPALEYIMLGNVNKNFDNSKLVYLKGSTSLKRLRFGRKMPITDKGLFHLSSLTQIEDLRLFDNPITNKGLSHLKSMTSLKRLTLDQTKVTDSGLVQLKYFKKLESLSVPAHIGDDGLAHVVECQNLKHLWAGSSSKSTISDKGLEHLSKLKNLEELLIGGKGITDKGLAHIAKLTNLKHLVIWQTSSEITNKGLAKLVTLKSLRKLEVSSQGKITLSGLSCLNSLTNLTYLNLNYIIQDNSGLDISGLTRLEKLTLSMKVERKGKKLVGDTIYDKDLKCLANLKKLKWFQTSYHNHEITDTGISYLQNLTEMERLSISSPGITDNSLKYLSKMKKLNYLIISGSFTDEGLQHLKGLKALGLLKIYSKNNLSYEALRELALQLPNLTMYETGKNWQKPINVFAMPKPKHHKNKN